MNSKICRQIYFDLRRTINLKPKLFSNSILLRPFCCTQICCGYEFSEKKRRSYDGRANSRGFRRRDNFEEPEFDDNNNNQFNYEERLNDNYSRNKEFNYKNKQYNYEGKDNYSRNKQFNYDGRRLDNYDGRRLDNYDGRRLDNYDGRRLDNYDGRKLDNYSRNKQFKYENRRNDNYSRNKQFNYEDGRPRFSHLREEQFMREQKMKKKNQEFDFELNLNKNENDETIGEIEKEKTEKKERTFTSIPYDVTPENRFEILNQIICPLVHHTYSQQLSIKNKKNMETLRYFGRLLKQVGSPVVRDTKGLPCPLELVKPSPLTKHYRNKDEFSIWSGIDGVSKTVGFFIGEPSKHNNVVCVEPEKLILSKESHKKLASKFETYLREVSPYDYCKNYQDGGNWRRFVVRSNDAGHHMAIAIMHPQQLTENQLQAEMNRIQLYFENDDMLNSMYFQATPNTRSSNDEQYPFELLFGETNLCENLLDNEFMISPGSFFQINKSAAEVLYRSIVSELNPNKKTTVLDICCGTGTLACILSPYVSRVIGIDSNSSAIKDANKNAALNNIKNVSFIDGNVETKLSQLMDEFYGQQVIVVANPTRQGLHASVITTIRQLNYIDKLVYVSCAPEDYAMRNFVHLCTPASKNNQLGAPFVPINAVPVDMFPHTNHCELIITFERFNI